jgi:hypothetical protein
MPEMAMSAIPLYLQRRFEQKWAARFSQPVTANQSKNIGAKAALASVADSCAPAPPPLSPMNSTPAI